MRINVYAIQQILDHSNFRKFLMQGSAITLAVTKASLKAKETDKILDLQINQISLQAPSLQDTFDKSWNVIQVDRTHLSLEIDHIENIHDLDTIQNLICFCWCALATHYIDGLGAIRANCWMKTHFIQQSGWYEGSVQRDLIAETAKDIRHCNINAKESLQRLLSIKEEYDAIPIPPR